MDFTFNNKIDLQTKNEMIQSFKHSHQTQQTQKRQQTQQRQHLQDNLNEPSMKWANKYLDYQFKNIKKIKSQVTPYPYDYDK